MGSRIILLIAIAGLALIVYGTLGSSKKGAPMASEFQADAPTLMEGATADALTEKVEPAQMPTQTDPGSGLTLEADAPSSAARATPRPSPPPHALSFRREGKLIVVFGDVLYGQLKDDDGSEDGFVRAKPVELWESGTIPYHIDPKLKNPERVSKTLQLFMEKTPIRFVPFNGQANAIVFAPGEKNCRSYLGRIGGHQPIYLDDKCGVPEISHEVMHALGFIHEQSRPDRDRFVKINWDKIDPEHASQYEIAPDEVARLSLTRPFDYKSTMLYEATMFAKSPGEITLESLTPEQIEPDAEGLSREDIERIHKLYSP